MKKLQTPNIKKAPNSKHQDKNLVFGIWILFGVWCLMFGYSIPTQAQSKILISQRLSKQELQSGFVIATPEQDVDIIINPNTTNRSVFIDLIKPDFYPIIPLDKDLSSSVYHYSILPATNNNLSYEITIQMKYPLSESRYKEIYIYNQELGIWQNLIGQINIETNTLIAKTSWASAFIAVFTDHLDKSEYLKKAINSESIFIIDAKTNEVLVDKSSNIQRPIASLTKLMTAAVFLDYNPGWDKQIIMTTEDDTVPSKIYVNPGEIFTTQDLFYATLLKSANNAAKALARSTGLTDSQFVEKMNEKAKQFGMNNTNFIEVTGLSNENVSTAQDLMILSKKLFSSMIFLKATTPQYITIASLKGKKIKLENSNKLLDVPYTILGSKTGFTYEAGRCLDIKTKNKQGKEIIVITLGASKPGAQWDDARTLLDATLGE